MGASVRPVATPDETEFQAWKAKQPSTAAAAIQTRDDAEFQAWKKKNRVGPGFASEATAAAPDQAGRRAAMAAQPPILSSGLPRELEQGATLGFGDEINAGVRTLYSALREGRPLDLSNPGAIATTVAANQPAHEMALQNERGIMHAYESAHPVVSIGAQLAGGVATGMGAARVLPAAVPAATRLGRVARIVDAGAATGAVAGAGTSEGDLADRAVGAARGAAAGAAVAPVVSGAATAVKRIVGPVASRALDATGVRAPATPTAPLLDDKAGVELTLPQRAARRVGVRSSQDRGDQVVLNTITRGGKSIDQLRTEATGASSDKPITLADIGGEGAQQLAAGARTFTESAAASRVPKILRGRAEGQADRLSADMTDASGIGATNPFALAERLKTTREAAANKLYPEAHAHGVVDDPQILELFKRPYVAKAWKDAQEIAAAGGRDLPSLTRNVEKQITFDGVPLFGPDGSPRTFTAAEQVKLPTAQDVHYIKRALDDKITKAYAQGGASSALGHELEKARDELTKRLYAAVPKYEQADKIYAEGSRMMDALKAGQDAVRKRPQLIEQEISALQSQHEQDLYRYGLKDALDQITMGRDKAPMAEQLAGGENLRQQLRLIAKDAPSADELLKRAGEERGMAEANQRILGGSNTMDKAGARSAIEDGSAPGDVAKAVTRPGRALIGSLYHRVKAIASTLNANTADAVANRLLAGTTDRAELLKAIDELEQLQKKGQLTKEKTRAVLQLPAASETARIVGPRKNR